jgi:transposase
VQREGFKLTAEWAPDEEEPNGRKKQLTAELVHQILKRISDEDSWTMGYVRLAAARKLYASAPEPYSRRI